MDWFCVEVDESLFADGSFHRLCRRFQRAYIAASAPPDMALFSSLNDNMQQVQKIYFSPACRRHVRRLIEEYSAMPCAQPKQQAVTLLFGVPRAAERLLSPVREETALAC